MRRRTLRGQHEEEGAPVRRQQTCLQRWHRSAGRTAPPGTRVVASAASVGVLAMQHLLLGLGNERQGQLQLVLLQERGSNAASLRLNVVMSRSHPHATQHAGHLCECEGHATSHKDLIALFHQGAQHSDLGGNLKYELASANKLGSMGGYTRGVILYSLTCAPWSPQQLQRRVALGSARQTDV